MAITRNDVLHAADLSHLRLTEDEVADLTRDLSVVLDYMRQLDSLETDDVPPTAHVALARLPLRPDTARAGLEPGEALREAPRTAEGGFAVPGFLDKA